MQRVASLNTRRISLAVAAAVVVLDHLTKWWAVRSLPGDPIVLIDDVLQLRYHTNEGAAFGMLDGAGSVIALVAIAAVVFIVLVSNQLDVRSEAVALGLVLGGATGNLLDRVFRGDGLLDGGVVDFIDFSFFPAFNVADSAITIGAGLALLFAFLQRP